MIKLTEEMKKMFSEQLPIVATINEDGTPNLGPKRSGRIYDDTHIVFNENTGGRTMSNIKRNGHLTIVVVDWANLKGYRFVGKAEVFEDGKYYDEAVKWAEGKMGKPKAVTVMTIERIDNINSGAEAGTVLQSK